MNDNFTHIFDIVKQYENGEGGYVSCLELTDADRNEVSAAINTLAEDLSTLYGKLGLN
ncbi:hypothetical protein [Pseudogemmobacter sonorensis]|uniref:hypothetical protein n=1 Tax=Pseudogemmobacter sonorensis TaxID=2989681 RepID=UPI0036A5FDCF